KPLSSVTASSLFVATSSFHHASSRQASLSCHNRRRTAPLPANQPPKLTVVLAIHHHNTLPLPANTPQNLLKTSSHSVQKLRKDDDLYLICYLAGCHLALTRNQKREEYKDMGFEVGCDEYTLWMIFRNFLMSGLHMLPSDDPLRPHKDAYRK
ncbi:hypothetical protein CUMW_238230, partial [Citrus unshiu]